MTGLVAYCYWFYTAFLFADVFVDVPDFTLTGDQTVAGTLLWCALVGVWGAWTEARVRSVRLTWIRW